MLRRHFSLNVIKKPITTDCALFHIATPYKALKLKVPLSTMNAKKRFAIVQDVLLFHGKLFTTFFWTDGIPYRIIEEADRMV